MPTRTVTTCSSTLTWAATATRSAVENPIGRRGPLLSQHVLGDDGLGVRDAEVLGPLVGHGQQPADPAGDGVLGHRRGGGAGRPPPRGPAARRPRAGGPRPG